jgi:predicted dehydrogenase
MTYRAILIGTGSWGARWCESFLPRNIEEGLLKVVAAVDVNPAALDVARKSLGLTDSQCFTDVERAFDEIPADFCIIVTPPRTHEEIVDHAITKGMHILSEKPIADTLEASARIVEKVERAGLKMGITMSHRFDADKTTLRAVIRSGKYGRTNYLVSRFTCDCRKYGTWGNFRHDIEHPLLIEGAVHHLDILADLAGAKCDQIYAQTWNPPWGEYAGDSHALVSMSFENGTHATYEGANTNSVGLNGWSREYIRVECELATLILSHRRLECFPYDSTTTWHEYQEGEGEEIPLMQQPKWTNTWLIEKFVQWLDGGEAMETNVEDNLQSIALVFAAIRSGVLDAPVKVQDLLEVGRIEARSSMR